MPIKCEPADLLQKNGKYRAGLRRHLNGKTGLGVSEFSDTPINTTKPAPVWQNVCEFYNFKMPLWLHTKVRIDIITSNMVCLHERRNAWTV